MLLEMTKKTKDQDDIAKKPAQPLIWLAGRCRRGLRLLRNILIVSLTLATVFVLLFRAVNPPTSIYIASEWWRLNEIKRDWTPIKNFPPYVARSVVAAEDANFCLHAGFDFEQIKAALSGKGKLRGASTLSQQTSKNVFLWQGRSWLRKGLEAGFTVLVELIWPKIRIVEVYLNVAEFDEGVFGVAAAGQHYFGVKPDKITRLQAARLAAILPNPKNRSASRPSSQVRKRTSQILSGEATIEADGRAKCFQ